jgi:hypothetical protein
MRSSDLIEFIFNKPWIHSGVPYVAGDKALLSAMDIDKLTRLGAGSDKPQKPDPFKPFKK